MENCLWSDSEQFKLILSCSGLLNEYLISGGGAVSR